MPCEKLNDAEFLKKVTQETLELEYLQSLKEAPEDNLTAPHGARKHREKMKQRGKLDKIIVHYISEAQRRGLSDEYTIAVQDARTRTKRAQG